VKIALLTLLTAQFFDFGTFVTMVGGYGPAAEANPLVKAILVAHGMPLLFVAKLTVVALVAAVVAVLVERPETRPSPRLAACVLTVGIVAGLIGGASNARNLF
jgi:cytochrome c biogenesis factor